MNTGVKWLLLGFAALLLLMCMGIATPLILVGYTLFGWIGFLFRVLPDVTVNMRMLAYCVAACAALLIGGHLFLRWLYQSVGEPTSSEPSPPQPASRTQKWRFL